MNSELWHVEHIQLWSGRVLQHLKSIRIKLIESTYVVARGRVVSIMQGSGVLQLCGTGAGFVDGTSVCS